MKFTIILMVATFSFSFFKTKNSMDVAEKIIIPTMKIIVSILFNQSKFRIINLMRIENKVLITSFYDQ